MNKRIKKKKVRMQAIKLLESLSAYEGVVMTGKEMIKFDVGQFDLKMGYLEPVEIDLSGYIREVVTLKRGRIL